LPKLNYFESKIGITFHTNKKKITALASLKELEAKLPHNLFIRIHKSYIVAIREILLLEGNLIEVNNTKLPVGKIFKDEVSKIFGV
jgi:DNA-binding LytR/AlgR family response regulator